MKALEEKEEVTTEAATEEAIEEKKEEQREMLTETMVYIGPTFYGVLQANTAFRGEYPPGVKRLRKKIQYLDGLFVPVRSLAESMKELKKPGTEKHRLYLLAEREA